MVVDQKKNVGVLVNQDELRVDEFRSFMDMTLENYNAGPVIPVNKKELTLEDLPNLERMDALVIAKPRKSPFTDGEKSDSRPIHYERRKNTLDD